MKYLILEELETDADTRSTLVEVLRQSAALLRGDGPDFGEPVTTSVRHKMSRELLIVAARLCEHARLHGDQCRYCETIVRDDR